MPDKEISVQEIDRSGLVVEYNLFVPPTKPTAAFLSENDAHRLANNGSVVFHFKNGDVVNRNVTIETDIDPVLVDSLHLDDRIVTVGANKDVFIGPFPPEVYGNFLQFTVEGDKFKVAALRLSES